MKVLTVVIFHLTADVNRCYVMGLCWLFYFLWLGISSSAQSYTNPLISSDGSRFIPRQSYLLSHLEN